MLYHERLGPQVQGHRCDRSAEIRPHLSDLHLSLLPSWQRGVRISYTDLNRTGWTMKTLFKTLQCMDCIAMFKSGKIPTISLNWIRATVKLHSTWHEAITFPCVCGWVKFRALESATNYCPGINDRLPSQHWSSSQNRKVEGDPKSSTSTESPLENIDDFIPFKRRTLKTYSLTRNFICSVVSLIRALLDCLMSL